MTNFRQAMQELSDAFETRVVGHETVRGEFPRKHFLREGSPDWMTSVIRACHGALDRMPDDWIYESIHAFACNLNTSDDEDSARDRVHEIADGLTDIYTSDLTRWVASDLRNVTLCDEAADEFGQGSTLVEILQRGQFHGLTAIGYTLCEAVQSEANDREPCEGEIGGAP